MRAIDPYTNLAPPRRPPVRGQAAYSILNPPLEAKLSTYREDAALRLFKSGNDTVRIGSILQCTPAAAANALARARDRERAE